MIRTAPKEKADLVYIWHQSPAQSTYPFNTCSVILHLLWVYSYEVLNRKDMISAPGSDMAPVLSPTKVIIWWSVLFVVVPLRIKRTGLWLRQSENICCHLKNTLSIIVNQPSTECCNGCYNGCIFEYWCWSTTCYWLTHIQNALK